VVVISNFDGLETTPSAAFINFINVLKRVYSAGIKLFNSLPKSIKN